MRERDYPKLSHAHDLRFFILVTLDEERKKIPHSVKLNKKKKELLSLLQNYSKSVTSLW